jgi:hypothetical protein
MLNRNEIEKFANEIMENSMINVNNDSTMDAARKNNWKYIPMPDINQNWFTKDNLPTYHEMHDYFLNNDWDEYDTGKNGTIEYKKNIIKKVTNWSNARLFGYVLPIYNDIINMLVFYLESAQSEFSNYINKNRNAILNFFKSYNGTNPISLTYTDHTQLGLRYPTNGKSFIYTKCGDIDKFKDIWFGYVRKYVQDTNDKKAQNADMGITLTNRDHLANLTKKELEKKWVNSVVFEAYTKNKNLPDRIYHKTKIDDENIYLNPNPQVLIKLITDYPTAGFVHIDELLQYFKQYEHTLKLWVLSDFDIPINGEHIWENSTSVDEYHPKWSLLKYVKHDTINIADDGSEISEYYVVPRDGMVIFEKLPEYGHRKITEKIIMAEGEINSVKI